MLVQLVQEYGMKKVTGVSILAFPKTYALKSIPEEWSFILLGLNIFHWTMFNITRWFETWVKFGSFQRKLFLFIDDLGSVGRKGYYQIA